MVQWSSPYFIIYPSFTNHTRNIYLAFITYTRTKDYSTIFPLILSKFSITIFYHNIEKASPKFLFSIFATMKYQKFGLLLRVL